MKTRTEKVSLARKTAAGGIVLLKNDGGVLPLAKDKDVVLMGVTGYFCHRMGFGSGDMLAQRPVQYDEGLANAGVRLFQPVADFYRRGILAKKECFERVNRDWWKWSYRFPEPATKDDEFAKLVAGRRDLPCLVAIGRNCGESVDLSAGGETGSGGDCGFNSIYLHWQEEQLLKLACANFDNVVVLLNVCGVVDTSWLDKYPVKAVLVTSLLGETSGDAVADVLTGRVSPAGKLTTTWAKRYRDYPTTDCWGTMQIPYREGVFLGYRYFDTFGVEPRFPFGFGLSYTTFEYGKASVRVLRSKVASRKSQVPGRKPKADRICDLRPATCDAAVGVIATVTVKNTGKAAGAEVVQCYVSMPAGKLEKPYQDLVAYARTPVLAPGASCKVELAFDLAQFASYDEAAAAFVLEKGDYVVRVGASSRATHVAGVLRLPKTVTVEKVFARFAKADLSDLRLLSRKGAKPFTYAGEKAEIAAAKVVALDPAAIKCVAKPDLDKAPFKDLPKPKAGAATVTMDDVLAGRATVAQVVAQMDDRELASCVNMLVFDDMKGAVEGGTGVGGFEGTIRGEASEIWHSEKYAIPPSPVADGPSGIRLSIFNEDPAKDSEMARTVVAYPCGTALAQGWDDAAATAFGRSVQDDMALAGIDGWLAPGLNLHRNPLCGRNFEYFSEDPLLAGRMAAAIARGVQTRENGSPSGRYVTIKHFCTNNQEHERGREENVVSERTLRELYLRAFRFACEGKPRAIMTSYNRLNGDWVATIKPVLTGIVRGEWGWDGFVMTDWWNGADKLRHQTAGNDLIAPGGREIRDNLAKALAEGRVPRGAVQAAAVRILSTVAWCLENGTRQAFRRPRPANRKNRT
ncbi:MAG: glycoside hydrolase family 3 protein [Kiritimatiellae bacterium]|nr:glycoside hydrolase family 3 protein [Kiritimatiellia bacterium]